MLTLKHRQVTDHHSEIMIHEMDDEPHPWVEVTLVFDVGEDGHPLSLTPSEARKFANALLNSADRVEARTPHDNS